MEKNKIELYGDKVWGVKVSDYGLEHGYLDYNTMSKLVGDCIMNNIIRAETLQDWEIVNGEFDTMIFQDYVISKEGYDFLSEFTDEIVFYNEKLDIFVWGITHFGTSWDYVLSDVRLSVVK